MPSLLLITALLLSPQEAPAPAPPEHALLDVLTQELSRTMEGFVLPDGTRPYYVAYTVTDTTQASAWAGFGAAQAEGRQQRQRILDVDVRVGDPSVDNTHKLRSEGGRPGGGDGSNGSAPVALEDDPLPLRQRLWQTTDQVVKGAAAQYQRVLTNLKTMVEEEDQAGDFTREAPSVGAERDATLRLDLPAWTQRLRAASARARNHPLIYDSSVLLQAEATNRFLVTSEGTRLKTSSKLLRVAVSADTKAEDGMELSKSFLFDAVREEDLPSEEQIGAALQECIERVLALREAPLVQPYTGPAILLNRASAVFFHEIFGHRIEGHRQRDVEEGQTFTKKIGESVLPSFLEVHDDPTLARWGEVDLRGHYRFDDEGVPARDVTLVEGGVLKTFLLSRQPVQQFLQSNGHGRRNPGRQVVARQGNLLVRSTNAVPFARLREMLVDECRRQGKEYGLLFEDITGGFTTTGRGGPQAFKVLPVVVWRVHADGRPDELVRGADIVGTPLQCFGKILCTGDDPAVFNGTCGAESGWVPVSAISPSILVSEIEIEKREHEQDRPPLLPPPTAERKGEQR